MCRSVHGATGLHHAPLRMNRSFPAAWRPVVVAAALLMQGCGAAPPAVTVVRADEAAPLPAFPGAEGAGRFALGGRGGRVFTVTNLDDAGPGSLRAAVEASGPRTVVFAVAGTIALKKPLVVRHGRLTIAGQTAPGDGITLRDQPFEIAADDVVVRFIRSRLGDESGVDGDAVGVVAGRRIVIDHVSASWSTDETLSLSARFDTPERSFDAVTVQWSVIAESLNRNAAKKGQAHGFGTLLRAGRGARISMHHNLWAHHQDRMPRPGNWLDPAVDPVGALFDFRSNVFYNWGRERAGYNLDRATRSSYNFVANAYLTGPDSRGALAFEESSTQARAFVDANTMNGVRPADPWSLVAAHREHLPGGLPAGYRLAQPIEVAPVRTDPAPLAQAQVLLHAGAALRRDAVDRRIVESVHTRGGRIIDSQREVGGWPVLQPGAAAPDRDGDGLPDAWERAHGLDADDPADGARTNPSSGYTHLEDYLAELAAPATPGTAFSAGPATVRGWASTRGGQGGRLVRVTTLAAAGPGSLREAIETPGPRIVVFEVGGVIDMGGQRLEVRHPHLTIAGQTAPSPGITVAKAETVVATHDVIVQHLAFRPGEFGRPKRGGGDQDGLSTLGGAHDVIVDHCSFSWATDENLSASGPRFEGRGPDDWRRATSHAITFSHNLVYEGLSRSVHEKGEHSKGSLIHDNTSGILLYGNVYVSNRQRNALFKGGARGAMVNNLIFNPGDRAAHYNLLAGEWAGQPHQTGRLALVGNVYRQGPDTLPGTPLFLLGGQGDVELHGAGNRALDARGRPVAVTGTLPGATGRIVPLAHAGLPDGVPVLDAARVAVGLPAAVGARPWDRDARDRRVLDEMAHGRGRIIDAETENPLGGLRLAPGAQRFDASRWNLDDMSPKDGWHSLAAAR